jgi:competence protein ComEC
MPARDARLVPAAAATWVAAWMTPLLPSTAVVCLVAVLAVLAVVAFRRRRYLAAASMLCAAVAGAAAGLRLAAVQSGPVADLARERAVARLELVVTSDPQLRVTGPSAAAPPRVVLRGRVEHVAAQGRATQVRSPVLVIADPDDKAWLAMVPGARVGTWGRLSPAQTGDPFAAVIGARAPPEALAEPPLVQRMAARLRAGLRQAVSSLPERERGLVPGLVVGDTSRLPPQLEDDFRTTGLAHLLAVSGANVAIVLAVVLYSARWVGFRGRAPAILGAAAIGGFIIVARPEPSVLRAGVMGLVIVAALGSGRRRQSLPALCVAVLVLVLVDPTLARSYGFALSVVATASILLLAPRWRDALVRHHWPRPLADAIAVPAAAQAACGPIIATLAAQVSLVAVPANLLVAPAVPAATVLGVLAAALEPALPPVAAFVGRLAGVPAWWIVQVAVHGADVPSAAVSWPGGMAGGAALAAVTVVIVLGPLMLRSLSLSRHGRLATLALLLIVVAGLLAGPVSRRVTVAWPPAGWLIVACDVGQGDAIALSAGAGVAVVVDAGPDPDRVDRCLQDLGVRRVPVLVLTHMHADHVDGLAGVLRGRVVGELHVSPLREPREQADDVIREAAAADIPVIEAPVGEEWQIGGLSWRVLWPRRIITTDESVPNNASVVLLVERAGVRLLLAGDVEPAAQRALVAAEGRQLQADVLKVPHHASRYQDPTFLAAVAPRVAITSVGADNDYGHPAAATEDLIRGLGAHTRRTDRDGDVAVVGSNDDLRVVARSSRVDEPPAAHGTLPGQLVLGVVPPSGNWRRRARVVAVTGAPGVSS